MAAFDSTNRFHKSIPGALASEETLRLRVSLPRSFGVSYCTLVLTKDGEEPQHLPMQWEGTNDIDEWWIIDLSFPAPALYFYHFQYETPWGISLLKKHKNAFDGDIYGEEDWILKVYSRDFSTPDAFKGKIIYQIFPDRFYFSGEPKKNVPTDRILHESFSDIPVYLPDQDGEFPNNDYFGADLKGIEEKLPYIKSLGAEIIYLNPICEAHSNHRYNTADYKKVDPLLGTEKDFQRLCDSAHQMGMKIILDCVFSHTGDDSLYFNKKGRYETKGAYQGPDSPYYDWYFFGETRDDYRCWWNIDTLPEVNEENPDYVNFITGENGVIDFWLALGADGVRLDVADELPDSFIESIRRAVKRHGEDKLVLGEVWEDAVTKISHGGRRRYFDGKQLDAVMNYPFKNAVIDFLLTGNAPRFMQEVYSVVLHYPPQAMHVCMNHLGTHDTERILSALTGIDFESKSRENQAEIVYTDADLYRAKTLLKMALAINYCLPGIPSIYYGDEAGMTGGKDPLNRTFYPWGKEDSELLDFYRKMGKFRLSFPVLKDGGFYPLSAADGCIAFLRYKEDEKRVAVIANNNLHDISYRLNYDMRGMWNFTAGEKTKDEVFVPANAAVILVD